MSQFVAWENEYKSPQLVTKEDKPQKDTLRFFKFLKKKENFVLCDKTVLDLGCGTGRNSNYIADLGNTVFGIDISNTAVSLASSRAKVLGVSVDYRIYDMGTKLPYNDNIFDLVLDVTSSNSLNEPERGVYLAETARVLKNDGYFFVKALCKDGDKNAKELIKNNPGKEKDTYINEDMRLIERVFSEEDFRNLYSKYFQIISLTKKTNYTRFKGQSYKRNFWIAYMKGLSDKGTKGLRN